MAREVLLLTKEKDSWRYRDSKGRLVDFARCTIGKYNGKTFMNVRTESETEEGYKCIRLESLHEVTNEIKFHEVSKVFGNGTVRILEEIEIDTTPLEYADVFFNEARETTFGMDGIEKTFKGYTFNQYWNGWDCPYFTKEVADEICKELYTDEFRCYYDPNTDTYYCKDDYSGYEREEIGHPTDINTPNGNLKVYDFSYGGWCWSEEEEDSNE